MRALMTSPDRSFVIAMDGEVVVGYAYAEVQRRPDTAVRFATVQLYVHQIGVLKPFRDDASAPNCSFLCGISPAPAESPDSRSTSGGSTRKHDPSTRRTAFKSTKRRREQRPTRFQGEPSRAA